MTKGKILAVDDEKGITEYLQIILQNAGYEVLTAEGGWEAWDLISAHQFDAVITDVRMDKGDGIELIEKISDIEGKKPKVAIMSAYSDISLSDVYERGAFCVIQKPPKSAHIVESITDQLQPILEKWQMKHTVANAKADHIDLKFPSFSEATKTGELGLGSGGLFIRLENAFPKVDNELQFRLKFDEKNPAEIVGEGITRWVRPACLKIFHTGIGVEIRRLNSLSLNFIASQIEVIKPKPFIPIGIIPAEKRG